MENFPIFATTLTNPNFAKYAELCGGVGYRVDNSNDLPQIVEKAIESNKPVIIEIMTDPLTQ